MWSKMAPCAGWWFFPMISDNKNRDLSSHQVCASFHCIYWLSHIHDFSVSFENVIGVLLKE